MLHNKCISPSPEPTGLGLLFARLLGLKRAEQREEAQNVDQSNSDRARTPGMIFFAATSSRGSMPHSDQPSMVITNPAPDASEPAVPTGIIQEIKLG